MAGTISRGSADPQDLDLARAKENFSRLFAYVANLYCADSSSSVSAYEAETLAASIAYTLGLMDATPDEAMRVLAAQNPIELWRDRVAALDARVDEALGVLREVMITMPPIRNVSLRDTLGSLTELRTQYDTHFAAHEVPCSIDYQLSRPVDSQLMGIDYIEAWLEQILAEARWIAQFDTQSCIAVLETTCPDYRGLHVNLYDLLLPHEAELLPAKSPAIHNNPSVPNSRKG